MNQQIKKLLHKIAHLLWWNHGNVETWYEGEIMMIGFRCIECGKLSGVQEITKYVEEGQQRKHV